MKHQKALEAVAAAKLAALGARTGVIERLTTLPINVIRQIIKDVTGKRPVSGQMSYTTLWYERARERLIHASVFIKIHEHTAYSKPLERADRFLLDYSVYHDLCRLRKYANDVEHVLDVNRSFHVLELYEMGEFNKRICKACGVAFIDIVSSLEKNCHACTWSKTLVCRHCGAPLPQPRMSKRGKKLQLCSACRRK